MRFWFENIRAYPFLKDLKDSWDPRFDSSNALLGKRAALRIGAPVEPMNHESLENNKSLNTEDKMNGIINGFLGFTWHNASHVLETARKGCAVSFWDLSELFFHSDMCHHPGKACLEFIWLWVGEELSVNRPRILCVDIYLKTIIVKSIEIIFTR